MLQLPKQIVDLIKDDIKTYARPLEIALFNYHFDGASYKPVIEALKVFQNEDGGFGHAIEPDIQMPNSSAIGTTVALQILEQLPTEEDEVAEIVDKCLAYLSRSYHARRMGWTAANIFVNDYPHAPWWHADEKGLTAVDARWGNPTVEILGHFIRLQHDRGEVTFKEQLDYAVKQLLEATETSEHELFCYISAYPYFNKERQDQLRPVITRHVKKLLNMNVEEWNTYVPRPLDFIKSPDSEMFGITTDQITVHMEYIIEKLIQNGRLTTNWEWGTYPETWPKAKSAWEGILTVKTLVLLKTFGRLEE
ncbi:MULTISPECIES: hypothetical protein [unclassified Fusibacter]|uniref:hypothetical protein n=1 Tax=unclassified Fusibacter TaxID=2624464 RepID=UPI001013A528|nr:MULTISPECIES: hypothetical protein [unclassified Fusibacter]MCK8060411.1 hypothetical protein [Fusibacter sp. A2]NPE20300.1 hypothetical protein [Fusibacter sp. A1]RXV63506.1 hypothetical protein DWB64_00610 [Fusibacter sp. A1]